MKYNVIKKLTYFKSKCALGRYPGSVFMDHVLRYQDTPGVKMIVVLGEVRNVP